MAFIHNTTLTPSKLELLASWLPAQPWYTGREREPRLTKAGGFRLDDPHGEVGIEFMVVTDGAGGRPVSYHVPLTYRGTRLDGADQGLIGTTEHGVLGRRWVYDGTHDPVLLAQLLALVQGRVTPQAQSVSDTPDPSVTGHVTGEGFSTVVASTAIAHGPHGTDVAVRTAADTGSSGEAASRLTVHVVRALQPGRHPVDARGHVTAGWRSPAGEESRGVFVVLRDAAP